MLTFNNDTQVKLDLLVLLKHHQDLDTFIKGDWLASEKIEGNGFKGCFYGCTMQTRTNPREAFSEKYNIDLWFCYITERIFEGLPKGEFEKFPYDSINILPVGFNFEIVKSMFHRGILLKQLDWLKNDNIIKIVKDCADLFLVPFNEIDKEKSASWDPSWDESAASWAADTAIWAAEATSAANAASWAASAASWAAEAAEANTKENYYIWMRDFLFQCIKINKL